MALIRSGINDQCPYSFVSLQTFLLLPMVEICKLLHLPVVMTYIIPLSLPALLLNMLVKYMSLTGRITFVKHTYQSGGLLQSSSTHPHSSATTLRVISISLVLGMLSYMGLTCITSPSISPQFVPLGFYLLLLTCFHFGEYFVTSLTNPSTLSHDSFLLNQSLAYDIAIICSFLEFLIETYYFPGFKKFNLISVIGLGVAILGDLIRKIAMFTAGKNFTHLISSIKNPDHRLVTHGIYGFMRHPSYAGWFYWAIGTQALVLNPICFILFFIVSYKFFKDRIEYEESMLVEFFQQNYVRYRQRVGTWMPISLNLTTNTN